MCELLPVLFAAFMPCYCFVGRYLGWWHKKVEDCSYIYLRSNIDGGGGGGGGRGWSGRCRPCRSCELLERPLWLLSRLLEWRLELRSK